LPIAGRSGGTGVSLAPSDEKTTPSKTWVIFQGIFKGEHVMSISGREEGDSKGALEVGGEKVNAD